VTQCVGEVMSGNIDPWRGSMDSSHDPGGVKDEFIGFHCLNEFPASCRNAL
jgi:hypothetical protein